MQSSPRKTSASASAKVLPTSRDRQVTCHKIIGHLTFPQEAINDIRYQATSLSTHQSIAKDALFCSEILEPPILAAHLPQHRRRSVSLPVYTSALYRVVAARPTIPSDSLSRVKEEEIPTGSNTLPQSFARDMTRLLLMYKCVTVGGRGGDGLRDSSTTGGEECSSSSNPGTIVSST